MITAIKEGATVGGINTIGVGLGVDMATELVVVVVVVVEGRVEEDWAESTVVGCEKGGCAVGDDEVCASAVIAAEELTGMETAREEEGEEEGEGEGSSSSTPKERRQR